jgi:hypothetical protein
MEDINNFNNSDSNNNDNNDKPVLLSIPGSAGLFPLTLAAAYRLKDIIKEKYPNRSICYAGVSSGTVPAVVLALDISYESTHVMYEEFTGYFDSPYKNSFTYWFDAYRKLLNKFLPEDAYIRLSNKLFIGRTVFKTIYEYEYEIVSTYSSNKEIVDTIISSCYLFLFTKLRPFINLNGKLYCDGAYIKNYVTLESHHNIIVKLHKINEDIRIYDWFLSVSMNKWNSLNIMGQKMININRDEWVKYIEIGTAHYEPAKINLNYLKLYFKVISLIGCTYFMYRYMRNDGYLYRIMRDRLLDIFRKFTTSRTQLIQL